MDTDHSTLAQILRGALRVPATRVGDWARKWRISTEEAASYIAAEHAPDARTAQRQHQLRHWTAEAIALTSEPAHWQIMRLCRAPEFQANCRWIAGQIGVSVDAVNLALSRLLRLGLLDRDTAGRWKDSTGLPRSTGGEFRILPGASAKGIDRMANTETQFQILSKTPDETTRFYATLFGWGVDANNPLGYRRIDTVSALLPEGDEMAVLLDPHGMSFAVWREVKR